MAVTTNAKVSRRLFLEMVGGAGLAWQSVLAAGRFGSHRPLG